VGRGRIKERWREEWERERGGGEWGDGRTIGRRKKKNKAHASFPLVNLCTYLYIRSARAYVTALSMFSKPSLWAYSYGHKNVLMLLQQPIYTYTPKP
jgi:hypothetical protein